MDYQIICRVITTTPEESCKKYLRVPNLKVKKVKTLQTDVYGNYFYTIFTLSKYNKTELLVFHPDSIIGEYDDLDNAKLAFELL